MFIIHLNVLHGKIIQIKPRSFKSTEHITEERDAPYRGFGYLSLFSDPLDLAKWSQKETL